MNSFAPEIFDRGVRFGLRFATKVEADNQALALSISCPEASDHRAVPSPDPVNSQWDYGKQAAVRT